MADKSEDETCDQTGQTSAQEEKQDKLDKQEALGQKKLEEPVHQHIDPGKSSSSTSGKKSFPTKKVAAVIGAGVVAGAAGVVAAPVIAGAALGVAGFTSAGVAAGSIAAAVQSVIGSVAAGSLFASLTSAGATGAIGAATTAGIGGAAGLGGVSATIGALKLFGKSSDNIKLLICGCGDGAHVFAGIASSLKGTDVRVLSLLQDEAERWSAAIQTNDLEVTLQRKGKEPECIVSKPALVTKNPEEAMRDVDMLVFMLPTSSHQGYVEALQPYIKPGTIIVGLPGSPEFVFEVRHVLGETARQCTIINFESLPWTCRTTEFGVKCEVLDTKETLQGTVKKGDVPPKKDAFAILQDLLGPLPKLMVSCHPPDVHDDSIL